MSGGGTRVDVTFGPKSYEFLCKAAEPVRLGPVKELLPGFEGFRSSGRMA
jgi:hypothetical protein